ncbi:MAG: hypothetical protein F4Z31_10415 [Gemmatimonadetes bacterium]|nr:hypothetical protein [Gemmatimonadota bacterium]MYJ12517.1 hypothetical protein [Gemmatimonadota bacterium]
MNNTNEMPAAGTWWQRNGGQLLTGLGLFIAIVTYMQIQFSDVRAEIRDVRTEIRDVRAAIDRVETKVDEVRGALNFTAAVPSGNTPPAAIKKQGGTP